MCISTKVLYQGLKLLLNSKTKMSASYLLQSCFFIRNQMLRRAQLYTTSEVEPRTVKASMDTTFKLDTALNLDCDYIVDTA